MLRGLSLVILSDWLLTLFLILGGCCSNALTLEQLTTQYPHSGSLITFFQFLVISLQGLPRHVAVTTKYLVPLPYLKPRQIPLLRYITQVILFYLLSLLNNIAFSYNIPMPVHIIFRSGGLVVSMIMGRLILGRKYNSRQVSSVIMVTIGVTLTTMSASNNSPAIAATTGQYMTGISLLTIALILSGFLGIVQDRTYSQYQSQGGSPWQESMFYLHFLSLPMFISVRNDIISQVRTFSECPSVTVWGSWILLSIPTPYFPLALNVFTQLFCVAGVNRLTTRVSSLTVTLILVVRKAVSLVISLLLFSNSDTDQPQKLMLWGGATLVFAGTVMYSIPKQQTDSKKNE